MSMRIWIASALCLTVLAAPATTSGAAHAAAASKPPSTILESTRVADGLRWPTPTQAQLDAARAQAQSNPDSAEAHFELAMLYARTCFLEEGWEALKRVNTLDPAYADKVVERFGAVTEADPQDLDSRFRLAFGYYFQGKKELAHQELERLAALAPRDPWPYNYLGFMVAEQNHLDLAQQYWQRALALDAENAVSHYLIGQIHYRQGRFLQAAQALGKAVSLRAGSRLKP